MTSKPYLFCLSARLFNAFAVAFCSVACLVLACALLLCNRCLNAFLFPYTLT
jgi:hypothetical protein